MAEAKGSNSQIETGFYKLNNSTFIVPPGNLNRISLFEGKNNCLLVLRTPQPKTKVIETMSQVIDEHLVEGFFDNPSSRIRMRLLTEQAAFAQKLKEIGIPTPIVSLGQSGECLIIDYIPDTEKLFDLWLKQDPRAPYATLKILNAVMLAHKLNLVAGDRTGKNELVTPEADIFLIDFDIKLSGSEAREFEFANLMYRLSRAAHRGSINQLFVLGEICKDILLGKQVRTLYNREILLQYIHRFAELSSKEGATKLHGMTPIIQPEYSAELFNFLIDVLKYSIYHAK